MSTYSGHTSCSSGISSQLILSEYSTLNTFSKFFLSTVMDCFQDLQMLTFGFPALTFFLLYCYVSQSYSYFIVMVYKTTIIYKSSLIISQMYNTLIIMTISIDMFLISIVSLF